MNRYRWARGLVASGILLLAYPWPAAASPLAMDPRVIEASCTAAWPDGFAENGQWTLSLAFHVSAQGELLETRVIRSSGSAALDKSGMDYLKRCHFTPASTGGKFVAAWSEITRLYTRSSDHARIDNAPRREAKE